MYKLFETGPSYLKICGNSTNKMRLVEDSIELGKSKHSLAEWKGLYTALRWESSHLIFEIVFPY